MNIPEIYDGMEYGPAPEGDDAALSWIASHGGTFGHFINGAFTAPGTLFDTCNPATGKPLAQLTQASDHDVTAAVDAARKAQSKWHAIGGPARARYLYAMARAVQKHARLFAVLEVLDNGKPIREARDIDVPLVQRHFYHHAGYAQLMDDEWTDHAPLGVCAQVIPWNFPLLMLAWKVAPALAAGNTVVLKPAEWTSLTALLFADICREAGLPRGVLNIVTGDGDAGESLVAHPGVDKVAFTGSTSVGRRIREVTAGQGKSLTLELGGKSPYIIFDDADLDSAVEGLVDGIWFNQGQVCCAGSRLLVQESVAEEVYGKIRARMAALRVGDPLDKSIDIGALADPAHLRRVQAFLEMHTDGERIVADTPIPNHGSFMPPTFITGLSPSDPLMQEEIFGPVLVGTTFRTQEEAVQLANNTRYGLAASIWSENVGLALGVAPQLAAGVVWINGTNMFDAAAPFGGVRESGFGREGGAVGLSAYLKPKRRQTALQPIKPFTGKGASEASVDRTHKLYIGGKQARPDGGHSRTLYTKTGEILGHAPIANRKDIRNAVEAARAARAWRKSSGHARAQVLYFMAENLSARADEFASLINRSTAKKSGGAEVDSAVDRLFTYAAWADKFDGQAHGVPIRGLALGLREPVGVIGAFCPDDAPLLGFISLLGPIMAMGNCAVLIASEPFPLSALELVQILETSDVPAGVVNVLTGAHSDLAPHLAIHADLDAVWSFSSSDLSSVIEKSSATNLKRTWVNNAVQRDWTGPAGQGQDFLNASTEVKTVWVPYGD